ILDKNGNFPWFQICVSDRSGDGGLIGALEELNDENVSENNAERVRFFSSLSSFLNEIPIYDVPNLFLIKLTDYKTLADMKGTEQANKAYEDALSVVRGVLRASDVVSYAGDGVILAYLLGIKDDMILCDRATSIISSLRISWGAYSENLKEVVSIGVSTVKHDGSLNISELYAKAAVALTAAEEKHKNTYSLYSDNIKNEEQFVGKNVSLHDIELVKNILDPIKTWAYAVDERLHLIYKNDALSERIPGESLGYCYKLIKGESAQCADCPLMKFENDLSSVDADVYSPGLRRVIHTRTTRLRMRNNIKVYIIADTKEDIGIQLEALKESTKHYNRAMQKIQDIIWEIDLDTLQCTRIREENILSMVEKRVEDYEGLRDYYLNHVVYPDDAEDFMYASSPARLRDSSRIGRESVDSKVRFLYQDGTYHWYSLSAIFEEGKVFLVARDINDLSHDIVQDYVTSRRFREIKTDSAARSELAKNYERSEHVNELTGIYVFEYDAAEKDYYLSTTFENMFEVSESMLTGEWTLLEGLTPHTDDREKYENFLHRVKSGSDTHEITIRLVNQYSVALWFTITVQTLQG
ncbi:MAG: PAS domain-containing protein, partial [Lachnospiraceae bacterium]|nr:PAS domain-containing protein [Lachnospiraceae bacterium]